MNRTTVSVKSGLRALISIGAYTGTNAALASLLHGVWLQLVSGLVAILTKAVSSYLTAKPIELLP